jgi:hypothetical protein
VHADAAVQVHGVVGEELRAIYRAHCPEKLGNVEGLLAKFVGREDELLVKMRYKYGVKKIHRPPDKFAGRVSTKSHHLPEG